MLEKFIKTYPGTYKHTAMVRHKGVVIAFAMNKDRRIWYTVLDLGGSSQGLEKTDQPAKVLDVDAWQASPTELIFPNEIAEVGFGVAGQTALPVFKKPLSQPEVAGTALPPGKPEEFDYFRSTTARFTEDVPFQVLSDGRYVYIFRQAIARDDKSMVYVDADGKRLVYKTNQAGEILVDQKGKKIKGYVEFNRGKNINEWVDWNEEEDNDKVLANPLVNSTLLVDRFLLVGTRLTPKMEVRYQRSRSKTRPASRKDSLGPRDLDGNIFYEPTQELKFIGNLKDGHFSVLLLPTAIAEVQRWQIFAENGVTGRMDSYNLERSEDGLFNTRGSQTYTCADHPQVYAKQAGKCSECGKTLVPRIVSKGYSESALEFDGVDDYVKIPNNEKLNLTKAITVEAWIKPDEGIKNSCVVGKDGYSLHINEEGSPAFAVTINNTLIEVSSNFEMVKDTWYHIAGAFDGSAARVFVNGNEDGKKEITGAPSSSTNDLFIGRAPGNTMSPFAGTIDEVRLWKRVRSDVEMKADMHHRLTGLESDLTGYWRFDEGGGSDVYDQTNNQVHGTIHGAEWVSSDAPVGEHPGIERASFEIKGRILRSAPASLLYYQQSKAASGYSAEAKPLKNTGRVMLAVATNDSSVENAGKNHIAALDFGVSASGRLAQIPDEVNLPLINAEGATDQSLNDLLDRLGSLRSALETARARWQDAITLKKELDKHLDDQLAKARLWAYSDSHYQGNVLELGFGFVDDLASKGFDNLISSIKLEPPLQVVAYEDTNKGGSSITYTESIDWVADWNDKISSIDVQESPAFKAQRQEAEHNVNDAHKAFEDAETNLQSQWDQVKNGASATMPRLHTDPLGLTISGGFLGFAWTDEAPLLFDSATGKLALYFRGKVDQFFVAYYDTFTERAQITLVSDQGKDAVSCFSMSTAYDKVAVEIKGSDAEFCEVIVLHQDADGKDLIKEAWANVPREAEGFAKVLNGQATGHTYIGSGRITKDGELTLLSPGGAQLPINSGATLMVGDERIKVNRPFHTEDKIIHFTGEITSTGVLPVYYVEYDYRESAICSRVAADLWNGSVLIRAVSLNNPSARVKNSPESNPYTLWPNTVCQWTAAAPGSTLALDGQKQYLEISNPDKVHDFDAVGDLTLEAWVKPSRVRGKARVIQHHTDKSQYALELEEVRSALRFDGEKDYISIPKSEALNFPGAITIEAWIKPEATDGTRNIVAHGYPYTNTGELVLRMEGGHYEIGIWSKADYKNYLAHIPIPGEDGNGLIWVHLAGVYDENSRQWILYRNGIPGVPKETDKGPYLIDADWGIGANSDPNAAVTARRLFKGAIDEVRIWQRARTQQEIQADMYRHLSGSEPGLVGYWHFNDGEAKDYSSNQRHGTKIGQPALENTYTPVASAGGKFVRAREMISCGNWTHLAAAYRQAYGLGFDGTDDYLDCGNTESLNINGDLTIDVSFQVDDLSKERILLERTKTNDPSGQNVPYRLSISTTGKVVFKFWDVDGNPHSYESSTSIETRKPQYVMVSRKRKTFTNQFEDDKTRLPILLAWDDINIYVNSTSPSLSDKYTYDDNVKSAINAIQQAKEDAKSDKTKKESLASTHASIRPILAYPPENLMPRETGRSDGSLIIGKGSSGNYFNGTIMEVRIWNTGQKTSYFQSDAVDSHGLVSWWRFEERKGDKTNDSKGQNHATITGAQWVENRDPRASSLKLYINGELKEVNTISGNATSLHTGLGECFQGEMEEVRIWQTIRTEEQIQDNLFRRIPGEKEDLIAYYTFDVETENTVSDYSLRGNHLTVTGGASHVLSTAPIGEDTPQVRSALAGIRTPFSGRIGSTPAVQEYGDMQYDSQGNLIGVFKRCYSYILDGQWRIITGYKVGDMVTEWIGQVQFAPQLIGFIEGAPPVPSENLTQPSVELVGDLDDYNQASSVELAEAQETTFTYSASKAVGADLELDFSGKWGGESESSVGIGAETSVEKTKILRGMRVHFESSGSWLEDASTGVSRTTGKTTSLELRGRYTTPEETIPAREPFGRRFVPDNVGLALVQSETADVFALRLKHNGALIAFQMRPNPDIPKDWNIIHFPINPRYVKQGTLDGKIGHVTDVDYPNALAYSSDSSYFKPIEAYALKTRIEREEAALETYYAQYALPDIGGFLVAPVTMHFKSAQEHAGFQALAQKPHRNLVNTYVWTTDGGLFAETQQTVDVHSETYGGSYEYKLKAGYVSNTEITAGKLASQFELNALIGGHLNFSLKKSKESKTSFQMNVNLDKVERDIFMRAPNDRAIVLLDDSGKPVKYPYKVDAYRFMSFYLEPESDHHEQFYNRVVDPIWLEQSDDPGAVALRAARNDSKKPPCWQVMHRVTYVSRILPPLDRSAPPSLEKTLQTLDIDSNYELIKQLEPYVRDHLTDFADFSQAVDDALNTYLPELIPHKKEVKEYLSLYYGLEEGYLPEPQVEGFGEGTEFRQAPNKPPTVKAGQDYDVVLPDAYNVLSIILNKATVRDDRLIKTQDLFLTWEFLPADGQKPEDVAFDNPHILETTATFTKKGQYQLRLTASDGLLSASNETVIVVNEAPIINSITAGVPERSVENNKLCWTVKLECTIKSGLGDPSAYNSLTMNWQKVRGSDGETIKIVSVTPKEDEEGILVVRMAATFQQSGYYLLEFGVNNGIPVSSQINLEIAARVTDGLQALYTFEDFEGGRVRDVSGSEMPLDLLASSPGSVTRVDGGLWMQSSGILSAGVCHLTEAVKASNAITIEAWIKPPECSISESNPPLRRILTLSNGPAGRNFILAQRGHVYHAGLRTTDGSHTDVNASLRSLEQDIADLSLTHVVFTRDADGNATFYRNTTPVSSRTIGGDFSQWDDSFQLSLGNEFSSNGGADRAWSGEYHLVAIYDRALSPAEVKQNFDFGADRNLPPQVFAGEDRQINWSMEGVTKTDDMGYLVLQLHGRVIHDRLLPEGTTEKTEWKQVGGPTGVIFKDAGNPATEAHFPRNGEYTLRLTATDDIGQMVSKEVKLTITHETPVVTINIPDKKVVVTTYGVKAVTLTGEEVSLRLSGAIKNSCREDYPAGKRKIEWACASTNARFDDAGKIDPIVTFTKNGVYELTLTAANTDEPDKRASASVLITVNRPPVVDAGPDQVIILPGKAILDAAISDDGLPNPPGVLDLAWTDDRKKVKFENQKADYTTASFPDKGTYTLKLSVSDCPATSEDELTVIVNKAPVVDAGKGGTVRCGEPVALEGNIVDDGFGNESQRVAIGIQWKMESGPELPTFINPKALRTTVMFPAKGEYVLRVTASDAYGGTADTVAFTVRAKAGK